MDAIDNPLILGAPPQGGGHAEGGRTGRGATSPWWAGGEASSVLIQACY